MTSFDFDFVMTSERLRHHYEQEHGISECTTRCMHVYIGVFYPFSFTGVLDAVFFLFYWLMLFVYKKRTRTECSLSDIYIFSTAHKPLLYWVEKQNEQFAQNVCGRDAFISFYPRGADEIRHLICISRV